MRRFGTVPMFLGTIERSQKMPASRKQKRKVKKVMHEFKHGELKSGGRRKVKSRRQAVAIAMSESGQSRNRKKKGAKRKSNSRSRTTAKRKTGTRSRKKSS